MNVTGYKKSLAGIKDTLSNELAKDKGDRCFAKVQRLTRAKFSCSNKIRELKILKLKKKFGGRK